MDTLIENKLISLNNEKLSWQDAIKKSASKLLEYEYINQDYVSDIINSTLENGAYYILVDNFALPHVQANGNVYKTALSLTTFDDPIIFENGREAQVFMTLASINSNDHLDILKELAKLLENENFVNEIINATSFTEIQKIIKKEN